MKFDRNCLCSKILSRSRLPLSLPTFFWRTVVCFVEMLNSNYYNNKNPSAFDTPNGYRKRLFVSLNLAAVGRHVCGRVRVYVQPISINDQRYAIAMMTSSLARAFVVVSSFSPSNSPDHCPYSNRHYRNHWMNLNWMTMMMNLNCLNYPMRSQWLPSNWLFRQFQPFRVLSPENFIQNLVKCTRHYVERLEKKQAIERTFRTLNHFFDNFGRPRTVLCQTIGKFVLLQKFCVTAIVSSKFKTTCQ